MTSTMLLGSSFAPRVAAPRRACLTRQTARRSQIVRASAAPANEDLGFKTMRAGIKEVRSTDHNHVLFPSHVLCVASLVSRG